MEVLHIVEMVPMAGQKVSRLNFVLKTFVILSKNRMVIALFLLTYFSILFDRKFSLYVLETAEIHNIYLFKVFI